MFEDVSVSDPNAFILDQFGASLRGFGFSLNKKGKQSTKPGTNTFTTSHETFGHNNLDVY